MRLTFQLAIDALPPAEADAVISALLLPLTYQNILYLRRNPMTPGVYSSGVRYAPEPYGTEDWLDVPNILARRPLRADCEDLAAWRAAELRIAGIEATPYVLRQPNPVPGVNLLHIVVRYPDGAIEDPSRLLGMGS